MGLFSQSKRKRIYDEITFIISATYASLTDEFIKAFDLYDNNSSKEFLSVLNQWALNAYDLAGSKLSVNGREPLMYDVYSDSYNKISNAVNTRNYLSVEILKDCFVKLYSFILTLSGEVLTDREKNNIRAFIDSKIEIWQ